MIETIILDTGPLGILTHPKPIEEAIAAREWMFRVIARNIRILIPEIVDYELRRELIRGGKTRGLSNLNEIYHVANSIPITTDAMRLAAQIWADARNAGRPTADNKSLDADVILAAQALSLELPEDAYAVATSNPEHIKRYIPAKRWQEITIGDF